MTAASTRIPSQRSVRLFGTGRGYARAQLRDHAALLRVAQRARSADVEDGLDAGGGDVGVLAARSGGAARAQGDLRERDGHAAPDHDRIFQGTQDIPGGGTAATPLG